MKKILALFVAFSAVVVLAGCSRANHALTSLEMGGVSVNDKASFIGEEKAKEIVLAKAGLSAEQVRFDRVELDNDGGTWYYEIEFSYGNAEYSADVNAIDGSVRDYEVDMDN